MKKWEKSLEKKKKRKRKLFEETSFKPSNWDKNQLEVRIEANDHSIARARYKAIDQLMEDIGFTELPPQYASITKNTTVIDFIAWNVDLKNKTYRKIPRWSFGFSFSLIARPSQIKTFATSHAITAIKYNI